MADFVIFQMEDGAPVLVNTERITCVTKHFKWREKDRKAIWSEDQTDISFGGDDGDDVVVNEPFASAVEKLTGLFWCDLSWAEGDSSPRSE